jgi:hypothetical protein
MRSILLGSHGVREKISGDHQERGALNEDLFAERLNGQGSKYVREKPLVRPIYGFNDTYFSGRLDYMLIDDSKPKRVLELKSSESKNVFKDVIQQGKYKTENLAQLISYMVAEQCILGSLIYTYYEREKSSKVLKKSSERCFEVEIDHAGKILVDGNPSEFTVQDQLLHQHTAAKCLNDQIIYHRPYKWQDFDGPCKRCPFNKVCEAYDRREIKTKEDFIFQAFRTVNNEAKGNE